MTVLLVALALATSMFPAAAAEPNAAGLVVQYGDGTRVYAYVQFAEDTITSEELLTRTGLDVVVVPFGGLGTAVCSIDGEGCPSSRCWCQSYSSPAYFWHFYALQDGQWAEQLRGMSSSTVSDGDVNGWLWTAGDTTLPAVTFEDIARANGIGQAIANTADPAIETLFVPVSASGSGSTSSEAPTRYVIFGGMLLMSLAVATAAVVRNHTRPATSDALHE